MDEKEKKNYEISFLLTEEDGAKTVGEAIRAYSGSDVQLESPLTRIQLSYPIKKQDSAIFGYMHFSFNPEDIKTLDESLRMNQGVLRFLIITPPFVKNKPRSEGRPPRRETPMQSEPKQTGPLSNEALEKKIEEILK